MNQIDLFHVDFSETSYQELAEHLYRCQNDFIPPLGERVNIISYAAKLHEFAFNFGFKDVEENLVAHIGAYFRSETEDFYVSNISVERNYRNLGLASKLLLLLKHAAKDNGGRALTLSTDITNETALSFYKQKGFNQTDIDGSVVNLCLAININENGE